MAFIHTIIGFFYITVTRLIKKKPHTRELNFGTIHTPTQPVDTVVRNALYIYTRA